MAQWIKCPTSAQVMISQFVGSSPTLGSVLTAQSLEPAFDSVSPSLSGPPLLVFSEKNQNKQKQNLKKKTHKVRYKLANVLQGSKLHTTFGVIHSTEKQVGTCIPPDINLQFNM